MDISGLLQLLQIIIAPVAVIVTYYAALHGAERNARLIEQAMIGNEVLERAEEKKREERQIKAIRLLLALEMRQNIIYLKWLCDEMTKLLGEERESYYQRGAYRDPERYSWLEGRQRFIALYMPDWLHGCWYGQQSSYLVSVALWQLEIRKISHHHSQLDRLTKIKNMLTERALNRYGDFGGNEASQGASSSFEEDAPLLWKEFVTVSAETLQMGNPLVSALEEAGVEAHLATAVNSQMTASNPPGQIEAGTALSLASSDQPGGPTLT